MANYVYIATSLDGFIASSDGGLDWLEEIPNPEKSDYGYAKFMSNIDAIVMGRMTYEKVLTFGSWPYDKPVYVLSKRGVEVPKELKTRIEVVNASPKKLAGQLKEIGHQNLYIDGGKTIQGFLVEKLIDEMIITKIPILLGEGIPLFGNLLQRQYFFHKKTDVFNNGLVKSHYKRREKLH